MLIKPTVRMKSAEDSSEEYENIRLRESAQKEAKNISRDCILLLPLMLTQLINK